MSMLSRMTEDAQQVLEELAASGDASPAAIDPSLFGRAREVGAQIHELREAGEDSPFLLELEGEILLALSFHVGEARSREMVQGGSAVGGDPLVIQSVRVNKKEHPDYAKAVAMVQRMGFATGGMTEKANQWWFSQAAAGDFYQPSFTTKPYGHGVTVVMASLRPEIARDRANARSRAIAQKIKKP